MSTSLIRHEELSYGRYRRDANGLGVVRFWLFVILFSSIFLQRLAAPGTDGGVPLNLFINLSALAVLMLRQQVDIAPLRAVFVLLFAAYVSTCGMFGGTASSLLSAVFAIVMYLPFILVLRSRDALFPDCLQAYRSMVLICAVLGIAQFLLQFVFSSPLLFTFEGYLPADVLMQGFGTLLRITYGSPLYRSNGFFMLEPSIFSQYVAVAVIIEILYYQSRWRLAVLGSALLLSYSGTGLITLALIPAILVRQRSYSTIIALVLFAALVLATSNLWQLDVMQQRATEFTQTDTSAHARFVAPADLISRYLLPDPRGLVFGVGPGSIRVYQLVMPFETHDPSWAKVLFEYGVIGSILFWTMFFFAVWRRSPSAWISTALTIGFLTFGGEFLDPRLQGLLLVFCVLPKQATGVTSASPRPLLMTARTA